MNIDEIRKEYQEVGKQLDLLQKRLETLEEELRKIPKPSHEPLEIVVD